MQLPHTLRKRVADALDEPDLTSAEFCGWDHAESRVWRCRVRSKITVYFKVHRRALKFTQEHRALSEWFAGTERVPRVLHVLSDIDGGPLGFEPSGASLHGLLLSEVSGELVQTATLSPESELEIHHQIGRLISRLHRVELEDTDPIGLGEAVLQRVRAWVERAQGLVDVRDLALLVSLAETARPAFDGVRRVACHRDNSPRNWLWDSTLGAGCIGLIDFEHARPDAPERDYTRLASDHWLGRPDLRDAFYAGLGREPDRASQIRLDTLVALQGVGTVVWAREHGDRDFEARGRRVVEEVRRRFGA